ncbi:MAG TPA: hypothetical protein EYN66_23325 [Myxococcales bacterium]|nr:hypothetical protein [Myxococcales bacterium]
MAIRVNWQGTIPAGSDANKMFPLGAVPEGKRFILSGMSGSGGDSGERYGINLVPASQSISDVTTSTAAGVISWLYPINGAATDAQPLMTGGSVGLFNPMIPGPCTICIASYNATAAALVVNMVGILEDL